MLTFSNKVALHFSHNKLVPALKTHTHHGDNTQTEPLTHTHIPVFSLPSPKKYTGSKGAKTRDFCDTNSLWWSEMRGQKEAS